MDEQGDLEIRSTDLGIARYRELRESSDPSTMSPEQRFIVDCMNKLIPAVKQLQEIAESGGPAKGLHKWGLPIVCVPADKIALIVLVTVVNSSYSPDNTFTRTALAIANAIRTEYEFSLFKKNAPETYKILSRRIKKWDRKALTRLRRKMGEYDAKWDIKSRTWLGAVLMKALLESTDCFVYGKIYRDKRTVGIYQIKKEKLAELEQQHTECELLRPFYLPMVVPPKEWSNQNRYGGYHFLKTTLMKPHSEGFPSINETNRVSEISPIVLEAMNRIQNTEYRINQKIRSVQELVWQAGGDMAGVPSANPIPLPEKPENIDSDKMAKIQWKKKASEIHGKNAALIGKRKVFMHQLWIARQFSKYPCIFFPVQLDWRGREYPKPLFLHPQADDCGRALLEFADAKELGEGGLRWLEIHLANCIGYDKCPFDQRLAEVRRLYDSLELVNWVTAPMVHRGWMDCDEPWRALAAACDYVEARKLPDPRKHKSRLPVAVDGSCNGLQHFSALGRDPIGGKAVNLIPSERPEDIYERVAIEVRRKVEEDCQAVQTPHVCSLEPAQDSLSESVSLPAYPLMWRDKVTRSTVKRAVMTTPYGVTHKGMRDQFIQDGHTEGMDHQAMAANYLKDVVYDAVGTVVVAAREYMDYLKMAARLTARQGKSISWVSPAGLLVSQEYLQPKIQRVVTTLQMVLLRKEDPDAQIMLGKQERSIAPNFVHSLDAAHMMRTCVAAKLDAFMPVHDSFSTHAADMEKLNSVLREEFVRMYTETDILADFKAHVEKETGVELPDLPKKGTLDITQVLHSKYTFH